LAEESLDWVGKEQSMRGSLFKRAATLFACVILAAAGVVATGEPAQAAALTQVASFGSNPGNLGMYAYVPDGLPANAPLVVALHGCTQSANDYYANAGWPKYADLWHFAVVFPQTTSANNSLSCFNWFVPSEDARGAGEALSIKQMVDYAIAHYGSDPHRVFITGLSAGGAMTVNLLADYPDVFAGGAINSGLPAFCATSQSAASSCQTSNQNKTPAQWGTLVRNAYSGYAGPWPRVAIWQGSADYTVYPVNATELRDQWTNVWGISQTASSTSTLTGGTTLNTYNDSAGQPAVELYTISGMGHGTAVQPGSGLDQCGATGTYYPNYICSTYYSAKFFGLDGSGGGTGGGGSLLAPTGLAVTSVTSSSVSLSWNAVSGAASYHVYRNGALAGSASGTTYTDTGLAAGATYSYQVAAVDSGGAEGAKSTTVSGMTSGSTPAQCYTDNNYNQVAAGRAHQSGGYAYANGSNQNMGLWNVFVTHTLKLTGPNYYVISDGGC
jgi:poly(hydroxyalkanoate) depolymerase family esterase